MYLHMSILNITKNTNKKIEGIHVKPAVGRVVGLTPVSHVWHSTAEIYQPTWTIAGRDVFIFFVTLRHVEIIKSISSLL